jgi:hypothetical protein
LAPILPLPNRVKGTAVNGRMIFRGAMSFVMSVCVIEPYGIAERQGAQRMSRGLPLMQNQLHGDVVSFSKCSFEFVLLLSRAVT